MQPEFRSLRSNNAFTESEWEEVLFTVDGIPLLVSDSSAYIEELGVEWNADFDDLPFHALAHLARYLPNLQETSAPIRRSLEEILKRHLGGQVELAIEAGSSVGADLRTLAAWSKRVIGFDSYVTPLRIAQRYIRGEKIEVLRRDEGRGFSREEHPIQGEQLSNVSLVCADALNPPFLPECADLIVAMNLLDNVSSPLNLLAQLDALLKPGGLMVIASPFNWNDTITPPHEQLAGSLDPAFDGMASPRALKDVMTGQSPYHQHLSYRVLEEDNVEWQLKEHMRCSVHYQVFVCALRKIG